MRGCHGACRSPFMEKLSSSELQLSRLSVSPSKQSAELCFTLDWFRIQNQDLTFRDLGLGTWFMVAIPVLDPGPELGSFIRIHSDSLNVRQVDLATLLSESQLEYVFGVSKGQRLPRYSHFRCVILSFWGMRTPSVCMMTIEPNVIESTSLVQGD